MPAKTVSAAVTAVVEVHIYITLLAYNTAKYMSKVNKLIYIDTYCSDDKCGFGRYING